MTAARDIKVGATLTDSTGALVYTVIDVDVDVLTVTARVRYAADGGSQMRSWDADTDTPLVNP